MAGSFAVRVASRHGVAPVDVLIARKTTVSRRSRTNADQPSPLRRTVQFSRVITPVEDIQVWNATSDGFSFAISFASRSGPGFRGNPGFIASWRPIHQNRTAVKVIGSPFKTFPEAEKACEAVLGYLKEPSGARRRSVHQSPGRDRAEGEEIAHMSRPSLLHGNFL